MITIIDYGLGNIRAFVNVYERLNIPVSVARSVDDLESVKRLILPGVGAFDHAMTALNRSGMRDALDRLVLDNRVPVLGICVGMQILANTSDEGELHGLGWVNGTVRKFGSSAASPFLPLPHMGWNNVEPHHDSSLFSALDRDSSFYFLHSYYFECSNHEDAIATTEYGIRFSSAIHIDNIYGVQFHPEKSHHWGIQLLKNFAEI